MPERTRSRSTSQSVTLTVCIVPWPGPSLFTVKPSRQVTRHAAGSIHRHAGTFRLRVANRANVLPEPTWRPESERRAPTLIQPSNNSNQSSNQALTIPYRPLLQLSSSEAPHQSGSPVSRGESGSQCVVFHRICGLKRAEVQKETLNCGRSCELRMS